MPWTAVVPDCAMVMPASAEAYSSVSRSSNVSVPAVFESSG